jgi:hypothetical protein
MFFIKIIYFEDYNLIGYYFFIFFLSKKYRLYLVTAKAERVSKYKMSLAVITGLPQQRGNQSSQPPSSSLRQMLVHKIDRIHPVSYLVYKP